MEFDLGPRRRLPEALADRLQDDIVSRRMSVGERLPTEVELARQFEVSRTVVREAARLLVQRGLVTVRPGSGMAVADFDGGVIADQYALMLRLSDGTFEQLLELRLILEVEMAALAAQLRSPEQLAAMHETNRELARAMDDRTGFLAADLGLHELIAEASGNPFFTLVLRPVHGFLRNAYSRGPGYPSEAQHTIQEHLEMAEAIEAGDPVRARAATRTHLRRIAASRHALLATDTTAPRDSREPVDAAQHDEPTGPPPATEPHVRGNMSWQM